MTDFKNTPEQDAILAEAKSDQSLIITALAGAAKTTTLCLLAKKLPVVPTLCCAFNKRIADEIAKRMPGHIQCSTMNSLGHRAWGAKLGRRLVVDTDKGYNIMQGIMDGLPADQKKRAGEAFSSLLRMVRLAKSKGYIPDKYNQKGLGHRLCDLDEFLDDIGSDIEIEPDFDILVWFEQALEISIVQAYEGRIDYDDQIYMSVLFYAPYPRFKIIMVDEAQDLSPLNHEALRRMFGGRLIAVGDPYQAIYGFRGAHQGSMALLKNEFNCKELFLSVSFRCPIAIVERARSRAPTMAYPEWAKPGKVERVFEYGADLFQDNDWIICRNNAPLFSLALKLIRAGRGVNLKGSDIGKSLVKILTKLGPGTLPKEVVHQEINNWQEEQCKKSRPSRHAGINDRAECLRVFADVGATLDESIAYANRLFDTAGPISFMTGHKSKGLENPRIFHLDAFLIPSKFAQRQAEDGYPAQLEQEKNLRYVIETRSQDYLGLIDSEDYAHV
jgi:superfamily I DNA/RNA helicase